MDIGNMHKKFGKDRACGCCPDSERLAKQLSKKKIPLHSN